MTGAERLARYEDLFGLPDNVVGEIIAGQLHTHPRPAPAHARASSVLGNKVGTPFDQGEGGGPGGWWVLDEPELHLSEDILVPDLAGWRRERMPALPKTAWFEMAPDWVCEVISPATARTDRVLKLPRYAAADVAHCWLIDPDARTLEAYANQDGRWLLLGTWGGTDQAAIDPFAAITLDLSGLWVD
ncbi:Uma2 family endonuclease [Acidithiobacillus sp. 'AMD consortium']|uniref:Uma2 family endonuclease n=1 Tax=Acidithiobacillus ferruginosus TaxID=3063951 RepID=A0ACD5IMG2_9PROT|nr:MULTISPECIES: Uma2 family endonuclease [Acidithiobacillus]MBU2814200.1 Uma2 family endonuclease [Acidithiobacillus ferruginosus]QFG77304.1 Uma2 family endonuclease [Acidithiobacillus sp. 'AMD consortium']